MKNSIMIIIVVACSFLTGAFTSGIIQKVSPAKFLDDKEVAQVAVIVKDIEKAAVAYAELFDMDVPQIVETSSHPENPTKYQGELTNARAKLAFFELDNLQFELIQPVGEPSTWNDYLENSGEGLHHIAFWVKGMDEHVTLFKKNDLPEVQSGGWEGGEYSYIDATEKLGLVIELLENYDVE
ncbi:MAG: VOC family protein [Bacteroidales bacterium]|nr:MAG: VOC family protein [Bacteroidales bacterium]